MNHDETALARRLKRLIAANEQLLHDLEAVKSLRLPQCFIAAGYIRNMVWDHLSGCDYRSLHDDIDVVYYDREHCSEERDLLLEQELRVRTGNDKWSVKNQARMHIRNGTAPYLSTADALMQWPETVTSIGARLNDDHVLELCHPNGLSDLFRMEVRRSPYFEDRSYYLERIRKKNWQELWPKLTIYE
ncbi:nucleotidyltransferase family protein [Paenibacillus silvisoli]|uniref:nucleotidyltransferase family protein n=1 Tax=Paenibacillus silvisoli TaxID=3110539 RepID=UPI0028051CA6|nr:nucleotidyltransferase family protein [Paenibacillus silvisoli]